MPHAEEVRPALQEPAGNYDAVMEFRRDVEASRITAEQRAQLQAMTRNILRQNAARDLSPVFAEPSPDAAPAPVPATCAAIDEELATLGYLQPLTSMAPDLAGAATADGRRVDEALHAVTGPLVRRQPCPDAIAAQAARQAQRAADADAMARYDLPLLAELQTASREAFIAGEIAREARALDALEPAIRDAVLDRLERAVATRDLPAVRALLELYGRTPSARRTA